MPKPFVQLSLDQFASRLRGFQFTRTITAVHMHHTWKPTKASYAGLSTIDGMWRFHTTPAAQGGGGMKDIAQHLSIAPDGSIWTGRDWNTTPASAVGFNAGVFMFETIGNFDTGRETLTGPQRRTVIDVIALVQLKCGLPLESLRFHREFTTKKTCPGTGVIYKEVLEEVRQARARLTGTPKDFQVLAGASRSTSRRATAYADDAANSRDAADRPFAERFLEVDERASDEGEVVCDLESELAISGSRSAARGGLSPEERARLRPHVVNLRQGRFSDSGEMDTSEADVRAIFRERLPEALAKAKAAGKPLRILFFAHGGLVDEKSGLQGAAALVDWWVANGIYPIYFVWETGLVGTLLDLIRGRRELAAARGLDDISDRALEAVARKFGGGKIWDGMKQSAYRSVDPEDGGARYVATELARFCHNGDGTIELHAVGHSAGAIFHSHFIPAALDAGSAAGMPLVFKNLELLAPAIRTAEFHQRLAPLLGRGIDALSVFTMNKDFERADNCGVIYRKSLLYLIHNALEARRGEPLLGLEESIRDDEKLTQIFGLGSARTPHEVIWSESPSETGRSASRSTTHGGFDNDKPTMESVVCRVLNTNAPVVSFPKSASRDLLFDAEPREETLTAPSLAEPEPVRIASGPAPEPRLMRALCIGIDEYSQSPLSGCVADANVWAEQFRQLGFEKVDLLINGDATEAGIIAAIRNLLAGAQPGHVLALQYSGHGTFFTDRDSDEGDGKDEALVPVDFDKGRFILDDTLFELLGTVPDGVALTCFFDCCHSGSMNRAAFDNTLRLGDRNVRARFINPTAAMRSEYKKRRASRTGAATRDLRTGESLRWVMFSACRDDEVALERDGQGDFTRNVARLVPSQFVAGTSNLDFLAMINDKFGPAPAQHPGLDTNTPAKRAPLLRLDASTTPVHGTAQPGVANNDDSVSAMEIQRRIERAGDILRNG